MDGGNGDHGVKWCATRFAIAGERETARGVLFVNKMSVAGPKFPELTHVQRSNIISKHAWRHCHWSTLFSARNERPA